MSTLASAGGELSSSLGRPSGKMAIEDYSLDDLLTMATQRMASDLHVTTGLPPMMRIDGRLRPMDFEALTAIDCQRLVYSILDDHHVHLFETKHELDFSYGVTKVGRYRVNIYLQRGSVGAAFRLVPRKIPTFDELGLPPVVRELTYRTSGLILVTGTTGSGKSTTLAAMIDAINQTRPCHVMTIEDPIEYVHAHRRAMVNQRELGSDTYEVSAALRSVVREDPDVILVGEMRDLETIDAALKLAETGHLVLATLHTRSAPQSIDRIIDVFPAHQQEQIRVLLAGTLEAVVAQQLLPKAGGTGRVLAVEVLVVTAGVRNLMREGKTHQIPTLMETGGELGMQTMDRSLAMLVRRGTITSDEGMSHASDRDNYRRWVTTL